MIQIKPQKISIDDFYVDSISDAWHNDLIDRMAAEITKDIDKQILDSFISGSVMTEEEKTIWIIKYGMKKQFGISFEEFSQIYENILKNNPEKLI